MGSKIIVGRIKKDIGIYRKVDFPYKKGEIVRILNNPRQEYFATVSLDKMSSNSKEIIWSKDLELGTLKEVKRDAKVGDYIKVVNPSLIPTTMGVPDYKINTILRVVSIAPDLCFYETKPSKEIQFSDLYRKGLTRKEYAVLEFVPLEDGNLASSENMIIPRSGVDSDLRFSAALMKKERKETEEDRVFKEEVVVRCFPSEVLLTEIERRLKLKEKE